MYTTPVPNRKLPPLLLLRHLGLPVGLDPVMLLWHRYQSGLMRSTTRWTRGNAQELPRKVGRIFNNRLPIQGYIQLRPQAPTPLPDFGTAGPSSPGDSSVTETAAMAAMIASSNYYILKEYRVPHGNSLFCRDASLGVPDALLNVALCGSPTISTFACDVSISLRLIPPPWGVGIPGLQHLTCEYCL